MKRTNTHKKLIYFTSTLITVMCFLLFVIPSINSQNLFYEQYTEADGLSSMQTYEMVQDSNGLMWIGTANGLVSFDGETFQRYSHPDFVNNDIIEIGINEFGRVYFINISGQLAYVENGKVEKVNSSLIKGTVVDILPIRDTTFIAYNSIKNGRSNCYILEKEDQSEPSFVDTPFRLFLMKDKGHTFFDFRLNEMKFYVGSEEMDVIDGNIDTTVSRLNRVLKTNTNRYFYYSRGFFHRELDEFIYKLIYEKGPERYVKLDHVHFLILQRGLIIYDEISKNTTHLFEDMFINTVFLDQENNVWVSSRSEGLLKIPNAFLQFRSSENEKLVSTGINDIIEDRYGNVYLGTVFGEIIEISKDKRVVNKFKASNTSRPLSFNTSQQLIIGRTDTSVILIDPEDQEILSYLMIEGAIKDVKVINDKIYVAANTGLFVDDLSNFTTVMDKEAGTYYLNSEKIRSLYYHQESNQLVLGTFDGLYTMLLTDPGNSTLIGNKEDYSISYIEGDQDGRIWLGTLNSGIVELKDGKIYQRYNTSNGLNSNSVSRIQTKDNKLYVLTISGVNIIDLDDESIVNLGDFFGIVPDEVLSFKAINNEYWIGTKSGLTILEKDQIENYKTSKPRLSVKNISVNGSPTAFKNDFELAYDDNTIVINYNNVIFNNKNKKEIKYRINEGSEWVYTTDPFIRLQSLEPGNYNVEAIGVNWLNEESNLVPLSFSINPPWWQTVWARVIGLIGILGIFQAIFMVRSRRLRREEEIKRDYLTQINRIKDQALQLQMNPHFIFNSLNAIQGFIGTDEEEKAMNFLARFARLIRLIFEHSKGNSISLDEEVEFIQLYVDLEKLRFKDKVEVHLNIDPALEEMRDVVNIPPLLIQPIVENSFKHGLFHKKGKGNVSIDYILESENLLKIVVQDNGIGRIKAAEISKPSGKNHVSSGFKTTKERIALLNFEKEDDLNSVEIEDLYSSTGQPLGTKTIIKLSI